MEEQMSKNNRFLKFCRNFNETKAAKILYTFVLASFVIPIAYLIYRIAVTDPSAAVVEPYRSRADYVLMLVQCVLGIIALQIPNMLARKFRFEVPSGMYMMFVIFLYCAIFLGEIRNMYYVIPNWDTFLHCLSGMMTASFGFMVVDILNRDKHTTMSLSPLFVALFAFSFSVSIGALWEIYEFSFDGLLGLNMQKFALEDGTQLVGREALTDTMCDIIIDCIGSAVVAVLGYISLKLNKGWIRPVVLLDDDKAEEKNAAPDIDCDQVTADDGK